MSTNAVPPVPLAAARSIAVLRANGIGDYLGSEPALQALRDSAPKARITLLGLPWHAVGLNSRAGPVDEAVVIPWTHGIRNPPVGKAPDSAVTQAFLDSMRDRNFDFAFQMHGGGRNSNPFVSALGAKFTVGLRAADAPALDRSISYQYWQPEVHKYAEVVQAVGAVPTRLNPRFHVSREDRAQARTWLTQHGVDVDDPIVVIHPGATDPRRRWPLERFTLVGQALTASGAQIVVLGDPSEAEIVAQVSRRIRTSVAGVDLSLSELVGLLEAATLLVGNDSGPRHLADAVGTATVSVYWFGNLINAGPQGRSRHRVHISWTTSCPVCGTSCVGEPFPERCYDAVSFVRDVETAPVLASSLELLEQQTRKTRRNRRAHT